MRRLPLDISATATVGTDGTATIYIGPQIARTDWDIRRITVTCTSQDLTPEARIYINAVTPSRLMGGTYNGIQDTNETEFTLQNLEKLVVQWTGADANSICVVLIQGQVVAA